MEYQLAQEAAERMGVSVRAIQKWAKEGKIPHAKKSGRDWLIPVNAHKPGTVPGTDIDGLKIVTHIPLPLLNGHYAAGGAMEFINSINDPEMKQIALGEYYYYTGDTENSAKILYPLIDSQEPAWRISAALMCVFNELGNNFEGISRAESIVMHDLHEGFHSNSSEELHALGYYILAIIKVQMHLPLSRIELFQQNIKHLPNGHKLFACYLLAYMAYLEKNFERALAIADTALACCRQNFPLATAYLHIIASIVLLEQKNIAKALERLDLAWGLLEPDNITMPFVEHYGLLQGLIEIYFKNKNPKIYNEILNRVKLYRIGWHRYYNLNSGKNVAENLSTTEFTVAMLYHRNWRIKEIAEHMDVSERTIKNYLQIIYAKLGINGKKELEKFLLV